MIENCSMVQFWINMQSSYPYLYKEAIKAILPFPTTYLCESRFLTMVHLKSKYINRLNLEHDMRSIESHFDRLVKSMQPHPSHVTIT